MVRQLIAALTLFLSFPCFAEDKLLVLTETTIGDMPIFPGMEISLYKIRQYFPFYRVVHEIGEGDSPDFHEYTVMTHEGDELLSFISYIDDQQGYERSIVPLDEIVTISAKVADAYGVSPGTLVRDALVPREELEFGRGHLDFYLGAGQIWYLFWQKYDLQEQPDVVIDAISWPSPKWR